MKKSLLFSSLAAIALLFAGPSASAQFSSGPIVNGGTYKITHYFVTATNGDPLCVEVAGNSAAAGAAVQQFNDNGNDAQRFVFELQADGSYKLRHKGTDMYIQTVGLSSAVFAELEQNVSTDDFAQRWVITENPGSNVDNPNPPAGLYEFKLKKSVGQMPFEMCMEVPSANNVSGQRLKLFDDNEYARAQRFQLTLISTPTATKNASQLVLKAQAYPNPFGQGEALSVSIDALTGGTVSISVIDALGHAVHSQRATLRAGANTVKLSNPVLAAGLYVVRVSQGKNTQQIHVAQQ
ncbi:RICIN domain-containing protein [Hymenobacter sp. IS2118]|uniref:RICIN domain-containing protein n=1 Tax=Hymenobacter sp. IS2118 TaxID=1505605 RepID=UPI000A5D9B92|nr:RICIN domain-containing protein [Hymenobacter sp. IS2118]